MKFPFLRRRVLETNAAYVKEGAASIRKQTKLGTCRITVGVKLEELNGRKCFIRYEHRKSAIVELTADAARLDKGRKAALRAFEAYAIDGFGDVSRKCRDKYGMIITKFEGRSLACDWREGARIATAMACLHAMGESQEADWLNLDGWEKV